MSTPAERAQRFLTLHTLGRPLLLANPWDVGETFVLTARAENHVHGYAELVADGRRARATSDD